MFYGAVSFKQDLRKWDVKKVENIHGMFAETNMTTMPTWYQDKNP